MVERPLGGCVASGVVARMATPEDTGETPGGWECSFVGVFTRFRRRSDMRAASSSVSFCLFFFFFALD